MIVKDLQIATIDDLRDLKYRISLMTRAHRAWAGHDWEKCEECLKISELRAGLTGYQRKRTAWLARARMEDRKELSRLENKIYSFKQKRRLAHG